MTTTTSAPRTTDSAPADDLTGDIVRTALGTDLDRTATDSVRAVQEAALDCLACAVVGSQDEGSHPVAQWAVETGGPGDATIIGTAQQTTAPRPSTSGAGASRGALEWRASFGGLPRTAWSWITQPSPTTVPAWMTTCAPIWTAAGWFRSP